MVQKCEECGLDISYTPRWKEYSIQAPGFGNTVVLGVFIESKFEFT